MITHNSRETQKLATQLAKKLLHASAKGGSASGGKRYSVVIGLVGDLGSGKTTFIQGFAKALGIKKHLTSPTFLIVRHYSLPASPMPTGRQAVGGRVTHYSDLYHVDTYRLKTPRELLSLGFKEILRDPKNIVLIEWADKIKKILPKNTIWINFSHGHSPKQRSIKIK